MGFAFRCRPYLICRCSICVRRRRNRSRRRRRCRYGRRRRNPGQRRRLHRNRPLLHPAFGLRLDPPAPKSVSPVRPQPVDPPAPQPVDPPIPQPVDPPVPQPAGPAFNPTCCGNILITDSAPSVLIWERDPSLRVAAVQATVYALPDNAEPLRLLVESDTLLELDVAPGNTVNYLGQEIRRLLVTVADAGPSTYAEGKYAVSVHR